MSSLVIPSISSLVFRHFAQRYCTERMIGSTRGAASGNQQGEGDNRSAMIAVSRAQDEAADIVKQMLGASRAERAKNEREPIQQ